jgi:peptide/nickel transport system permease protein
MRPRGQRLIQSPALRKLIAHPGFIIGFSILAVILVVAILGHWFVPHPPMAISLRNRFIRPGNPNFWLGTDHLGRDLLSRLILGAGISLRIGFMVAGLSGVAGTIVGALAGYFRKLDGILMRVMDALMAFPAIMLAIAIAAALGPSDIDVVLALSAVYVPTTARIVRASILSVKEMNYVEAAIASGARPLDVLVRQVLPNSLAPLIVQLSFIFAYAVLAEAALSYLGAGTPPPTPSWGNMIADGRSYMRDAPWITLIPGLAVALTVLALNLLGDALRDALDPRIRDEALR